MTDYEKETNAAAAAIFSSHILDTKDRYEMAHESIQIVQTLWGSWGEDAWKSDQVEGKFADMSKFQPINLSGKYYASRGPLPIPPSEQGNQLFFRLEVGEKILNLQSALGT